MSQNRYVCLIRCVMLSILLPLVVLAGCSNPQASAQVPSKSNSNTNSWSWSYSQDGTMLQIGYGSGTSFPQYGVLDLTDSYFRLVYSTTSSWGTSIILLPSFWSQTSCPPPGLCQGASVNATPQIMGANLVLFITGTIGGLSVSSTVTLSPPAHNVITAQVTTTVTGNVNLDKRPGEAFKPVMLSSMNVSPTQWDTQAAFVGSQTFAIPQSGWIIQPPIVSRNFGLQGGTSSNWKMNAPTVEITMDQSHQITGWVTQTNPPNPNADNVGFWCATSKVLHSWSFSITAEAGTTLF